LSDDEASRAPRQKKRYDRDAIVRNLKTQVWTGALLGLAAASVVGAVFLYVVSSIELGS
jgi:high-affinity Fe2+/Pb2+ permease